MASDASGMGASGVHAARRHRWIAPPFDGPPTGGTRYGAALAAALVRRGVDIARLDASAAIEALARGDDGLYWVDSLYLDRLPELKRVNTRRRPLVLVAHYLPSLVADGDGWRPERLSRIERDALACADALLATSTTMVRLLAGVAPRTPIACVEPGVEVEAASTVLSDPPRVLVLANVTEGKGVLPLLREIAARVDARDRFDLSVVGSLDRDPAYARACLDVTATAPILRDRVHFTGALAHAGAMHELARADLLLSASRMESYGMALAEARAAGVPMLAHAGGHAAAHVAPEAGGELVADAPTLATRFLALVRDPAELARRKQLALAHTTARSWDDAARDFIAATPVLVGQG